MELSSCRICPRSCGVARGKTGSGFCKSGGEIRISRAALHLWEEPPISGKNGSGAVFFTGCPLGCLFCQNYEISAGEKPGKAVTPQELSEIFFSLIAEGAHNINLVTPTHFAPMIREALLIKKPPVPVIYNTSGYESVDTLRSLKGLIDIYLPDYKYAESPLARDLSGAEDYPETALAALKEMAEQVGFPRYDGDKMMTGGLLIRHLILPGHTQNSIKVLENVSRELPGFPVSLMAQYTPWGKAAKNGGITGYPELSRGITKRELEKVSEAMFRLNLDGFVQSRKANSEEYIPEFY